MKTSNTFSDLTDIAISKLKNEFRFGLEAEYLVTTRDGFEPLWHKQLKFDQLNAIFETISLNGIPSLDGLDLEAPATKLMPFVVEGYHLPDMGDHANELLPKGVEIRTPVCDSLDECLRVHALLYGRLREALGAHGYELVALSHHPTESKFSGPQNKRRHDYWQWSMEVMTTYGPDINVSLPASLADRIDPEDLEAKINYYGPALSALSVASPFSEGAPWMIRGEAGKSFRMHKRSYIAPPIEFHPNEKNRLEFKVFDMANSSEEFAAQFLSFLALVLDDGLKGRATKQTRIYDLGQVARKGLQAECMTERANELISRAPAVLRRWGFDTTPLAIFEARIQSGKTPADEMLALFAKTGSLKEVLKMRSQFQK